MNVFAKNTNKVTFQDFEHCNEYYTVLLCVNKIFSELILKVVNSWREREISDIWR